MNLVPTTAFHRLKSGDLPKKLDFQPYVYVPSGWPSAECIGPDTSIPGALCVLVESVGYCTVLLKNLQDVVPGNGGISDSESFLSLRLAPNMLESDGSGNYRRSTLTPKEIEAFESRSPLTFSPQLLCFTEEQHRQISMGYEPGNHYSSDYWASHFKKYGLAVGAEYDVEYLYGEGYVKVHGIDVITSLEVWSLSS